MSSGYIAAASFAQRQLRYLDLLQPGGSEYALPLVLEITGALNEAALRQAFDAVIDRHDVLRASFPMIDDIPALAVLDQRAIDMPAIEIPAATRAGWSKQLASAVTDMVKRPFNLEKGPVLAAALFRPADPDAAGCSASLAVVFHHSVADGASLPIFLGDLVIAYDAALTVYTREKFPMEWASVRNNSGSIHQALGQRTRDVAEFEKSAAAFRDAASVYTRQDFPLDWAMTSYNLGNTLQLLGNLSEQPAHLEEAIAAYRDALGEYKRETAPRPWALVQSGLGATLQQLAMAKGDMQALHDSIAARRSSLEVLTKESAPTDWASTQNGIGMSLINLSSLERTPKYLDEAEVAFKASLEVYTREAAPIQWAFGLSNLGDVYWNKASFGDGGKPGYRKALDLFDQARQGFADSGYTLPIQLMDNKIELVKKQLAQK